MKINVQQGHIKIVGNQPTSRLPVCCCAVPNRPRSSKPASKLFWNSFWFSGSYRVTPAAVCYGGEYSSKLEENEAKAKADRIDPRDLPAILAGHRAGNEVDSDRLQRGFTWLIFEFFRKRERWLREHPPEEGQTPPRPAEDLLGKWFLGLVLQLKRCANPKNKSFQFPPEKIEGYIVGQLLKSAQHLDEEELGKDYLHALAARKAEESQQDHPIRWTQPQLTEDSRSTFVHRAPDSVEKAVMNEHKKILTTELRRMEPFAETRFEKSVIGLALSDYDIEQIRETLHYGVTEKQIIDALETIRERADRQR